MTDEKEFANYPDVPSSFYYLYGIEDGDDVPKSLALWAKQKSKSWSQVNRWIFNVLEKGG